MKIFVKVASLQSDSANVLDSVNIFDCANVSKSENVFDHVNIQYRILTYVRNLIVRQPFTLFDRFFSNKIKISQNGVILFDLFYI